MVGTLSTTQYDSGLAANSGDGTPDSTIESPAVGTLSTTKYNSRPRGQGKCLLCLLPQYDSTSDSRPQPNTVPMVIEGFLKGIYGGRREFSFC